MSHPPGQPKTLQIGVVLPPHDQYRQGNFKDRLAASMPLFLDHHDIPGVTAVDLAIAPHPGHRLLPGGGPRAVRVESVHLNSISRTRLVVYQPKSHIGLERETRLELATSTLGRSRSTN